MGEPNQTVSFIYKGSLPDGEVFDECLDEPYEIRLRSGVVMRPIDDALMEMEVGEERTLNIPAQDAYGEYNEDAVQMGPAVDIEDLENIPVGEVVLWRHSPTQKPVPAKVVALEKGIITLDFNHPLAGKDLVYWLKRIS